MKAFTGVIFSLLATLLVGCVHPQHLHSAAGQAGIREKTALTIEQRINQIVRETGDWEMSQFRVYRRADLDGDEVADTLMLTTFEQGNVWRRDMLVCLSGNSNRVMLVHLGGKGERMAEDFKVDGKRIVVKGKEYAENDPSCCPSRPYQKVYSISGDKIVETR